MLDGLRQAVGNFIDNTFHVAGDKYPFATKGKYGPVFYTFLHPIEMRIYDESHQLATERLNLLDRQDEVAVTRLQRITDRINELDKFARNHHVVVGG